NCETKTASWLRGQPGPRELSRWNRDRQPFFAESFHQDSISPPRRAGPQRASICRASARAPPLRMTIKRCVTLRTGLCARRGGFTLGYAGIPVLLTLTPPSVSVKDRRAQAEMSVFRA